MEFKDFSANLFLFFVFVSVTIEKIRSASAFEWGNIKSVLASCDKFGKARVSSKRFFEDISNHILSISKDFNLFISASLKTSIKFLHSTSKSLLSMLMTLQNLLISSSKLIFLAEASILKATVGLRNAIFLNIASGSLSCRSVAPSM